VLFVHESPVTTHVPGVGDTVGTAVGVGVGDAVGTAVGPDSQVLLPCGPEHIFEQQSLFLTHAESGTPQVFGVGVAVGMAVGDAVGTAVGSAVGAAVGIAVGVGVARTLTVTESA
jgi:hypothetical protein